jgi:light-regulated signal transduction histidine kinase (bacteriophytochrome)
MLNSTKIFRTWTEMYRTLGQVVEALKAELVKDSNKDVTRIIHDLTSINAHSIQELYNLVPRRELVSTHREQLAVVKHYIAENPNRSAAVFLRMVKHNAAMKAVLNLSNKLHQVNPVIRKREHSIRNVVFAILYNFLQDFNDKGITLNVAESDVRLLFDYDSVHVVLYNVFENATKYAKRDTQIDVRFNRKPDILDIVIEMQSLKITDEDMRTFFDEGIRGEFANMLSSSGDGIGMSRAKAILDMHGGRLIVDRNSAPSQRSQVGETPFEANRFIIRLSC